MRRLTRSVADSTTTDAVLPSRDAEPVLDVRDLTCHLPTPRGLAKAVDGVSFRVHRGQTVGIAGESGSGKSMLVRSIMGLTPRDALRGGSVRFGGDDLLSLSQEELRGHLGRDIAMVFQDPMTALNPVVPIARQMTEAPRRRLGMSRADATARALELLELVGIPEAKKRLRQYPHQLSGGMRQRVTIAVALACDPDLLIADEATTALDVTVQKQILDLLQEIQRERNMAMIMVSHDIGVLAGRTDELMVMYGGRVMERATTPTLFARHQHPYTRALLEAVPRMNQPRHSRLRAIPGVPPDPTAEMGGCRFAPRCPAVMERCHEQVPPLVVGAATEHEYACFHPVTSAGDLEGGTE